MKMRHKKMARAAFRTVWNVWHWPLSESPLAHWYYQFRSVR